MTANYTEKGVRSLRDSVTNKRRRASKLVKALFIQGWTYTFPFRLGTIDRTIKYLEGLKKAEKDYTDYEQRLKQQERHNNRIGIDKFIVETGMPREYALEYIKQVPMSIEDILRYKSERGHLPAPVAGKNPLFDNSKITHEKVAKAVGIMLGDPNYVDKIKVQKIKGSLPLPNRFLKGSIFESSPMDEIIRQQLNNEAKALDSLILKGFGKNDGDYVVIEMGASMGPTEANVQRMHLSGKFLDEMRKLTGFGSNTLFTFMRESELSELAVLEFARSTSRLPSREEWPLLKAEKKQYPGLFEQVKEMTGKSANDWIKEGAEIVLSANTILRFVLEAKRLPTEKEVAEIRQVGVDIVLLKLSSPNQ